MATDSAQPPRVRLQLSTVSEPEAVRRARLALETFQELQADDQLAYKARLLVSELVTNAVTHGGDGQPEHVEFAADLDKQCLRVEVRDGGAGFILGDDGALPDLEQTSGRGLYLLRTLADRFGADRSGGGRVWFEIDLK